MPRLGDRPLEVNADEALSAGVHAPDNGNIPHSILEGGGNINLSPEALGLLGNRRLNTLGEILEEVREEPSFMPNLIVREDIEVDFSAEGLGLSEV